MRINNVLILIALVTLTCTNAFDFASFVELGELKNDPYGKSLIQTISMTMEKRGGKIEHVQGLLSDLLAKLITDQKKSDYQWGKEKKRLTDHIRKLRVIIAQLESEIAGLKKQVSEFRRLKRRSERNLRQYTNQRIQNINSLNNLKLRRNADRALYKNKLRTSSAIIGALQKVINALRKLKGSIAGVNRPGHVRAIRGEFAETSNDSEISAFLELATTADQHALRQLIRILKTILHQTKVSLAVDEAHEQRSKAVFKKLKLSLKADIATLNTAIKKQRTNLDRYVKKINELTITIKIRTDLLHSRRSELKATIQERRTKENKYIRDKKHRNREKKVIRRVQKIVNERLARMNSYLKSKVN